MLTAILQTSPTLRTIRPAAIWAKNTIFASYSIRSEIDNINRVELF